MLWLLLLLACGGSDDTGGPSTEADCGDDVDDDFDGRVDCNDFDCSGAAECGGGGGGGGGDDTDGPPGDDTDGPGGDDTDPPVGPQEEVISVQGNDLVDVLLVVDNSGSMTVAQARLVTQIQSLFTPILGSGTGWHIGVITTDTDDTTHNGKLQGAEGYTFLDATVPGPAPIMEDLVRVGTSGPSAARARRAIDRALNQPTAAHQRVNAGFLQGGALHVVVISDSLDSSGSDPTSADFITMLQGFTTGPVGFHTIAGPVLGCVDAESGNDYLTVTAAIGGLSQSVCDLDWTATLQAIGHAATGIPERYPLGGRPDPSTIRPWIIDGGATYDGADVSRGDPCDTPTCFTYVYEAAPPIYGIRMTGTRPRHGSELHIAWEPAAP